jgi:DNA-binding transcriptional LysR family regulator
MAVPARGSSCAIAVRFDLTTLKLFVSVIDQGSIARAAEGEHIVPSAASKRISELESQLGVALLVRQHAGVIGTAAGEALARHAREVIHTLERIPDALSTLAADDQPDIRILATQTAVVVLVADLARDAKRPPPKMRLDEGHSLQIIESVAQGTADLGVIGHFQPANRLRVIPYRRIPLKLVVPASHPLASRTAISFAEALEFDFITLVQGTAIRGWALAAAARMARKLKFTMQVQSYEAMRAMVHGGLGIAIIPEPNIAPYTDLFDVRALPLADDWAYMQLYIVCAQHTAGNAAIDDLLERLA